MFITENNNFIFNGPVKKAPIRTLLINIVGMAQDVLSLFWHPHNEKEHKYRVSIQTMFKNEAPYLREWLEYHLLIGVEHFYLYNNNSTDNYMDILKKYINEGIVTLIDFPKEHSQKDGIKDCLDKYGVDNKWIGFTDIDEFIVPLEEKNIYNFLKKYNKRAGSVLIYWKQFGASGYVDRDCKELVIEDFTKCFPKYSAMGKCFFNTDYEYKKTFVGDPYHWFIASYKGIRFYPKNCFMRSCIGTRRNIVKSKKFPIQLNHYRVKSYNEYLDRINKGDAAHPWNPRSVEVFYSCEKMCTEVDYKIQQYLTELKERISN